MLGVVFGGGGCAAPLLGGGSFDAPFRLCEQRERFSCFPFFPYHGEERTCYSHNLSCAAGMFDVVFEGRGLCRPFCSAAGRC